jgi:NADPH-dependent glutamate synthase beta subunit-like oxidoreductase/Na+-translocating ferredoxin:NAD+ oxidoreductase RNF subunit RnfB
MLEGTISILVIGFICGIFLAAASKVFYVYVDPRIEEVEACFAGANCGGCGYTGCYAAAAAVVAGNAPPSACIVGGPESAVKAGAVMGVEAGVAEPPLSLNECDGGVRAADRYIYDGFNSCRAQALLYDGSKVCKVGCLGLGDCIRACLFGAISIGPENYAVVDEDRCVGCGACESVCPKGIIRVRTRSQRLFKFNAFKDALAPCRQVCPAEIDIPTYIAQIRNGDYEGAVNTIRERNPLLLACGRVCPHPCEDSCRRGIEDEPVSINQLKRFVADYEMNKGERVPVPVAPDTGKRVAVVGGGPAGLSCAFFLRRLGHSPTIYESMPKLGGMLRYGIPEYRLPKATLDWEIQGILDLGISVQANVVFGRDISYDSLREEGYDAIFLGIGAWKDSSLRVEGEDLHGCFTGIDFLSRLAGGEKFKLGKVATIIGGGNTAIDCVRNLLRLGVEKVYLVYRRTRSEMPANEVEIEAAEAEGVQFVFLAAPTRVVGDQEGKVTHLEYLEMQLGEPDSSGRRRPVPIEGSETLIETDMVITAIGQSPEISFLEGIGGELKDLKTTRWNTFDVDSVTLQSNIPGLFAAGDAATGPSLVVEAIGGGRRAARSIHQYLMDEEVRGETEELSRKMIPGTVFEQVEGVIRKPRAPMPELEVEERIHSFIEVDQTLSEDAAKRESERCLHCCRLCYDSDAANAA